MINTINGNNTGLNHTLRLDTSKRPDQPLATTNECKKKDTLASEKQSNSLAQANETCEKNTNKVAEPLQNKDIVSLISTIEDSRKLSEKHPEKSHSQPPFDLSEGQLIIMEAGSSNNKRSQFINELLDNFNEADENKDHLISSQEARDFANRI